MLDLDAIQARCDEARGYAYEDIPALIAEDRKLRQAIRGALARMERSGVAEAYPWLLLALVEGK